MYEIQLNFWKMLHYLVKVAYYKKAYLNKNHINFLKKSNIFHIDIINRSIIPISHPWAYCICGFDVQYFDTKVPREGKPNLT